jgi:ribosome recycling factor
MESVLRDSISETRRIMFLGSCKGIDAARSQAAAKASTLQMVSRGECQGVSTSTQRHLSFGRNSVSMLFPLSIKNFQRFERGFAYVGVCVTGRSLLIRGATTEDVEAEKELIELDAMERMEKTFEATRSNFNTVRTGRASPSLLDRVEVEYYGTPVILKSIAQVSTPDGSTLLIQPFDKSSLAAIEKALIKSDLGLTPSNDGNVIRLTVPQLTADRRKELLKLVSRLTEDGKVALRNVRRDAMKAYDKLEKEKKLSADNVKDLSEDIQKLTDEYVKKVETLFKQKEKELTTV